MHAQQTLSGSYTSHDDLRRGSKRPYEAEVGSVFTRLELLTTGSYHVA